MAISDNVRTILISKNTLDPLADWSRSVAADGGMFGNRERPEILQHQARNENYQDGLRYRVQPQDAADFIEALSNSREAPEQRFALGGFHERFGIFWGRNKFIYASTPNGPSGVVYENFSKKILENVLNTASTILTVTKEDDDFDLAKLDMSYEVDLRGFVNEEQFRESGARRFLGILRDSGAQRVWIREDHGATNLYEWFILASEGMRGVAPDVVYSDARTRVDGVVVRNARITMHDLVYGTIDRLDNRMPEYVASIAKYLVIAALTRTQQPIIQEEQIVAVLDKLEHSQFYNLDIKIDTPYIKNSDNSRFLNNTPPGTQICSVTSTYEFYNERYERAASSDSVPEIALPNLYARRFYQRAVAQQNLGSNTEQQRENVQNYLKSLSLSTTSGSIVQQRGKDYYDDLQSSIEAGDLQNFYETYSQLIEDELVLEDAITQINSTTLTGIREVIRFGDPFGVVSSPMSLGVTFKKDGSLSDFSEYCVIGAPLKDPSVALLHNLFTGSVEPSNEEYSYSTEYLLAGIERQTPHMPVNLQVYRLSQGANNTIFDTVPSGSDYQETLLQTRASVPREQDLSTAKDFVIGTLAPRRSRKTHQEIIDGLASQSEVLGYRLEKFNPDDNSLISTVLLGQFGSDKQTYQDTQVKYGQEYSYALSEYRFMYGTPYNVFTLTYDMSVAPLLAYYGELDTVEAQRIVGNIGFSFINFCNTSSDVDLVDVPIYNDSWNKSNIFDDLPGSFAEDANVLGTRASENRGAGGIGYPRSKVIDFPPTAPTMQFFPKTKVNNRIDININTQSGKVGTVLDEEGNWDNVLKIVKIGDNDERITEMKQFQDYVLDGGLEPDEMVFKQKGITQTRNIILYRTTSINTEVDNYQAMYSSFNPVGNPDVSVQKFTTKDDEELELDGITRILSYDITENINPNTMYYFTCVVEDIHGSISNPSMIYQVRLVSDKGLIVPEVKTVYPTGAKNKNSQKNLIRFIQVEASNIQTFPVSKGSGEDISNFRSLGKSLGKTIEDQGYILRFVSKDTGRKFDLKLNFVVRIDGAAFGDDT